MFTNKERTTHLYKALSVEFHNRLLLGEVKQKESQIIEDFSITKFPTLIAINKQTNESTEFTGNFFFFFRFVTKIILTL